MATNKSPEHFDVIKKIFTDKNGFNSLSDLTLDRNSFMVNRSIAIKYPDKVQLFNNLKVNQVDVMKFWADYLGGNYRMPGFLYTKGSKKASETKSKINKMPSGALIHQYCIFYNLNKKDVLNALKFFYDDTIKDIYNFEKEYLNTK